MAPGSDQVQQRTDFLLQVPPASRSPTSLKMGVAEPKIPNYLNIDSSEEPNRKRNPTASNHEQDGEPSQYKELVPQESALAGQPASQSRLDSSSCGGSISFGVSNKHPSGNVGSAQGVPSSKHFSGSTPPVHTRDTRELPSYARQGEPVQDQYVIQEDQEQSKSSFYSMEAAEEGEAVQ